MKKLLTIFIAITAIYTTACGSGWEDDDDRGANPWQGTVLFGTPETDQASDITLDNSGNIYLTGRSAGDLDGNTNSGLTDIFLAKFKPSGEKEW
ncbi:MAG: hypothetical protein GY754_23195, partial [bacterium]|nr:hypothetical protein [bacterium]